MTKQFMNFEDRRLGNNIFIIFNNRYGYLEYTINTYKSNGKDNPIEK